MLVELKNGETLNGHLVMCDNWMNLTLKEVVQTSPVRCPSAAPRQDRREKRVKPKLTSSPYRKATSS